jgi:peroxiredoxin
MARPRARRTRLLVGLLSAACLSIACTQEEKKAASSASKPAPVSAPAQAPDRALSKGDELPDISAIAQTGAAVSLTIYRDRSLLLFFCQSLRSQRCTALAQRLTADWSALRRIDAGVVGVSRDYRARLREVAYARRLPFFVLADPDGQVFRAFGLGQGGSVFVVDAKGEIRKRLAGASPVQLGERAIALLQDLAQAQRLD